MAKSKEDLFKMVLNYTDKTDKTLKKKDPEKERLMEKCLRKRKR